MSPITRFWLLVVLHVCGMYATLDLAGVENWLALGVLWFFGWPALSYLIGLRLEGMPEMLDVEAPAGLAWSKPVVCAITVWFAYLMNVLVLFAMLAIVLVPLIAICAAIERITKYLLSDR